MNIVERLLAPTPNIFRVLRNIGLALTAASGAILAAPLSLPAALVSVAGYLAVGGSVLSAVSQITVDDNALNPVPPPTDPPVVPEAPMGQKAKRKKPDKVVS